MTATCDDVWRWLEAGWSDLRRSPSTSLGYGLFVAALSYAAAACPLFLDAAYLLLPLAAGFMFGGPLLAVGLYEISRRRGERPSPAAALGAVRRAPLQLAGLSNRTFALRDFARNLLPGRQPEGRRRQCPKRTHSPGQGCLVEAPAWRQGLIVATPRPNAYARTNRVRP